MSSDGISPICLSVWIHPSERPMLVQNVLSIQRNEDCRIVVYTEGTESTNVPINLLRNLCIRQVLTSHYIVLDANVMPSDNLYTTLRSIPSELLSLLYSSIYLMTVLLRVVWTGMVGKGVESKSNAKCSSKWKGTDGMYGWEAMSECPRQITFFCSNGKINWFIVCWFCLDQFNKCSENRLFS